MRNKINNFLQNLWWFLKRKLNVPNNRFILSIIYANKHLHPELGGNLTIYPTEIQRRKKNMLSQDFAITGSFF